MRKFITKALTYIAAPATWLAWRALLVFALSVMLGFVITYAGEAQVPAAIKHGNGAAFMLSLAYLLLFVALYVLPSQVRNDVRWYKVPKRYY